MSPEIGHYALVLALALALYQSVVPIWGSRKGDAVLMGTAVPVALGQLAFVTIAFASLTYAYLVSDFSVENVYLNSHSTKPLIYKISGVWGNHEGSMVLWVLILVLFSGLVALFGRNLPLTLKANVLAVQAWVTVAFLVFILKTSNPFTRLTPAPFEGRDLNPLLQDVGLAIHPPLLYLGYVGFSMSFAFAVAALIDGRIDAAWARWVRPWVLTAWMFLTAGISMGSYWAYYELGWGGWWFWDPVENASLMPWLVGTALLHSAIVMEKREALKVWTILLAILTFSLSLLGTFLVRSGVLTSVHAFAVDPERGVFILAILVIFIGGSLALYAWRAPLLKQGGLFAPISREGALVFNNLFLTASCAAVFVGTLYPLALESLTGAKISVGPPFFNWTFGPLMVPLMVAMVFGPMLAWKRGDLYAAAQRLTFAFAIGLAGMVAAAAYFWGGPVLAPVFMGLGVYIVAASFAEIGERTQVFRAAPSVTIARARGLPRSAWGTAIAHAGVGVMLIGVTGETAYKSEKIVEMRPGETVSIENYTLTLEGLAPVQGPNYRDIVARLRVTRDGRDVGLMEPAKRVFTARNMPTTEAALMTRGFSQLYVSPGDPTPQGGIAIRLFYKPLVLLIWIGTLVMMLGAILSLSDRRLRVGAPKPAARKTGAMQPAE